MTQRYEEKLNTALEMADICTFKYFPKEHMCINSDAICRLYGYEKICMNMPDAYADIFVSNNNQSDYFAMFEKINSGEEVVCSTFTSKDGQNKWKITITTVEYDNEGKPVECIGVVSNISYQMHKEQKYKRENELLTSSLLLMKDTFYRIACIDIDNNLMESITVADDEIDEAVQFRKDYRKTIIEFSKKRVDKEYQEQFLAIMLPEKMKELFDAGIKYTDITYKRLVKKEYQWIHSEIIPLADYCEGNRKVIWYVRDVSKEKLALLFSMGSVYMSCYYINISDRSFYTILRNGNSMDVFGETGDAEKRFSEYCNKSVEEDFRESVREFVSFSTLSERLQGHEFISIEYKVKDIGWCRASFIVVKRDIEGQCRSVLFAVQVIDDEKKKELDYRYMLKEAVNNANRANQAKSDFLSRMSHDMRTPMNAIIGMTEIANMYVDDKDKVLDCLDKISVSGRHLLTLINEVLDMNKIESGKLDLIEEEVDIKEIINDLGNMLRDSVYKKHHELIVDTDDIKHETVITDGTRLQQALMNFMSNAVKYTPDGGKISCIVSESPSDVRQKSYYQFVIEDNGIGMSDEFVEQIFEPFARAEDTRINKIEGSGLGIPIAGSIISKMDGDITVESRINEGSKFTITIPFNYVCTDNDMHAGNSETEEIDIKAMNFSGYRILLAEDNDINAEIACEILEMSGFGVDVACNGMEALERYRNSSLGYYDMILMDIQMPEMNGYDATVAIRSLNRKDAKEVPILAMTANAFTEDVMAAKKAGMNEHIAKPLDISQMYNILTRFLKK